MILPETESLLSAADFTASSEPSKTYAIDFDRGRVTGTIDEKEALKQTISMILDTQRFSCPIFSTEYGVETGGLYGKPFAVILSRVETYITDALLTDDRIYSCGDFAYEMAGDALKVTFNVVTDFGNIEAETEVMT